MEEETMLIAIFKDKLFSADSLSYFKQCDGRMFESSLKGIGFQLCMFDWLSHPGVGGFGCPFKAGKFFTTRMKSGKLGVWLCVAEVHDNAKESGELLAFFVGYKDTTRFYSGDDLNLLISHYRTIAHAKLKWFFDPRYENHSEL